MAEKQFLTKKGYDERVARLEELKVVRRKEVAQKLKAYNTSLGSNRPAPGYGSTSNKGIAYRLYFDVNGKDVELDVDEKTFDNIKEGDKGVLDYKGCEFYSFTKE